MLCQTAVVGVALGTVSLGSRSAVAQEGQPKKPERRPIFKSLKFGMIKGEMSILDKFKLVQDLGYDGVELDSPIRATGASARRRPTRTNARSASTTC